MFTQPQQNRGISPVTIQPITKPNRARVIEIPTDQGDKIVVRKNVDRRTIEDDFLVAARLIGQLRRGDLVHTLIGGDSELFLIFDGNRLMEIKAI